MRDKIITRREEAERKSLTGQDLRPSRPRDPLIDLGPMGIITNIKIRPIKFLAEVNTREARTNMKAIVVRTIGITIGQTTIIQTITMRETGIILQDNRIRKTTRQG
jgi:hypothetical protein